MLFCDFILESSLASMCSEGERIGVLCATEPSVGIMFYKTFFGVDKEVDMTEDGAIRGFDSTSVGRQAFDLITDLLNRDPEARLTAVQATEHPFLRASTLQV